MVRNGLCFESRARRDSSPHCGTGVLARRFAFAGLKFWWCVVGSVKSNGRGRPFCIRSRPGERRTSTSTSTTTIVFQPPNPEPQTPVNGERRTANEHEHEREHEFEFEFEFEFDG